VLSHYLLQHRHDLITKNLTALDQTRYNPHILHHPASDDAALELQVRARLLSIRAGGIGSPLILRRTGIKTAGQNFFFDPLMAVMGTL